MVRGADRDRCQRSPVAAGRARVCALVLGGVGGVARLVARPLADADRDLPRRRSGRRLRRRAAAWPRHGGRRRRLVRSAIRSRAAGDRAVSLAARHPAHRSDRAVASAPGSCQRARHARRAIRRRRSVDQRPGDRSSRGPWRCWRPPRGVMCRSARPDRSSSAARRCRPLWPYDEHDALAVDTARGENDNSLVVAVGWRGRSLLFAGDLEADGEAALLARAGPSLPADVVKVPHHGSKTSSTAELVAATHPSVAVISVGERNRWGFPNAGVMARWRGRRRARDAHRSRRWRHRHRRPTRPDRRRGERCVIGLPPRGPFSMMGWCLCDWR